jgi:probable HAF family extracellular repeat protein
VALAALSVLAISAPGIAQQYSLTPVGDLGGQTSQGFISQPFGINNAGTVVGIGYDVHSNQQAFVYSSGGGNRLLPARDPTVVPPSTYATAINAQGAVVGVSPGPGGDNAVLWPKGAATGPTDLGSACVLFGPPSDSRVYAINSNGDAAGTTLAADCGSATTDEHAAWFSHGTVTDLGTLGGTISEAFGINESGVIVGYSFFDPSNTAHAFSWDGSMHDLRTFPGGLWSYAYAINASGVIVGYADTPGVSNGHAFVVSPGGTLHDLTPGRAFWSQASAINTSGQIVGRMGTQTGSVVPFLYSNGRITDLNTMIDRTDPLAPYVTLDATYGYGLLVPVSINDNGWIATMGTDKRTGAQQAYLLIPNTSRAVTLSPTKLSFFGQPRTTTSAAQTVKLTSGGIASLRISSITPSSGFVVKHTCPLSPATLSVGTSCMISVSSRPTIDGPYSGSVKIVDDAAGSPHIVPLAGTGTDFSFSASPTSQTTTPGTPVHYTVTVAPRNGFKGAVALSCTGAPTGATCAASPASLTINGTNSAKSTVTVATRTSTPKATYTLKFAGQMSTLRETTSVTVTLH